MDNCWSSNSSDNKVPGNNSYKVLFPPEVLLVKLGTLTRKLESLSKLKDKLSSVGIVGNFRFYLEVSE